VRSHHFRFRTTREISALDVCYTDGIVQIEDEMERRIRLKEVQEDGRTVEAEEQGSIRSYLFGQSLNLPFTAT
jgi:hypothetical protein